MKTSSAGPNPTNLATRQYATSQQAVKIRRRVPPSSLATPNPPRNLLELVRDIRVPGGEILYDREMRNLRRKKV